MNESVSPGLRISLTPQRIVAILSLCVVGLLLANAMVVYLMYVHDLDYAKGLIPLFYINNERSIPAFFSSSLFLVGAAGFYLMHRVANADGPGGIHWLVLSLVFIFLGADEATAIHELLIEPMRASVSASGIFFYAWVIPYGLAVLALGAYLLRPLLALQPPVRTFFFLSAIIYLSGVIGMEMVGGAYVDTYDGAFQFRVTRDLIFELLTTMEESMEMIGLILLIYAQLRFLKVTDSRIVVRVR